MNTPIPADVGLSADPISTCACPCGDFQLRNPFQARSLTWLCRQHLVLHHGYANPNLRGLLRHWLQHKFYRLARSRASLPQGRAAILVNSEWREFSFNPANTQFESIYAPAFRFGYEPETAVLIDALLPANGVMMDIGANWGHVSLVAASRPGFHGQIHAFEPMPPTYADLVASVRGCGMEKTVTTHNLALADHEGMAQMSVPGGEQSGLASLQENEGTPVRMTRLDLLNLPPDLIKIDVEGFEASVLRGAHDTLREKRPMIIFESGLGSELHGVLEPFQILEEQDYRFFVPAFVRDEGKVRRYTSYGQNGDLQGAVTLALVPFTPQMRWLMLPHANIFACHADRVREVAAVFERARGESPDHVPGA